MICICKMQLNTNYCVWLHILAANLNINFIHYQNVIVEILTFRHDHTLRRHLITVHLARTLNSRYVEVAGTIFTSSNTRSANLFRTCKKSLHNHASIRESIFA